MKNLNKIYQEHWQPKPIDPPAVDPHLKHLTGVQRSAEVFRFSVLSIECWLSPLGRLREWLRLNGKVSAILLIPGVLVLPLVLLVTGQLADWLGQLISISGRLIAFPLAVLVVAALVTITIGTLRALPRHRQ